MRIYYAHSLSIYNSPQEQRDINLLRSLEFDVFNPNHFSCEIGYKAEGMAFFERVLDGCAALAFRGNPGGSINAGIVKEIEYMKTQGKPIIELPSWCCRQLLSVEDTRGYLAEVGKR